MGRRICAGLSFSCSIVLSFFFILFILNLTPAGLGTTAPMVCPGLATNLFCMYVSVVLVTNSATGAADSMGDVDIRLDITPSRPRLLGDGISGPIRAGTRPVYVLASVYMYIVRASLNSAYWTCVCLGRCCCMDRSMRDLGMHSTQETYHPATSPAPEKK